MQIRCEMGKKSWRPGEGRGNRAASGGSGKGQNLGPTPLLYVN